MVMVKLAHDAFDQSERETHKVSLGAHPVYMVQGSCFRMSMGLSPREKLLNLGKNIETANRLMYSIDESKVLLYNRLKGCRQTPQMKFIVLQSIAARMPT